MKLVGQGEGARLPFLACLNFRVLYIYTAVKKMQLSY